MLCPLMKMAISWNSSNWFPIQSMKRISSDLIDNLPVLKCFLALKVSNKDLISSKLLSCGWVSEIMPEKKMSNAHARI